MNPMTPEGRAELFEQLSRAIDLRSAQDQVLWSIFGFFGATNAVLLSALFQAGTFPSDGTMLIIVVTAGIFASLAWHLIQRRAIGHIKRHEALMEQIERELQVPARFAVSAALSLARDKTLGTGVPARVVMGAAGAVSCFLWVVVLTIHLLRVCDVVA